MHISFSSVLAFFALSAPALATSALTITIPPSSLLPNPNALPAGTHATLTTLPSSEAAFTSQTRGHLAAPLTRSATFSFHRLPPSTKPESYLLEIRSPEYIFTPYRVDIAADGSLLGVWETIRGNPWDNRGAEKFVLADADADADANSAIRDVNIEAKVLAKRGFFEERSKFSPLALFKNPMILIALVALGFTFGMPKLMENMDPEMRAEFEKQSRTSPITGATRSAMSGGGAPGNFDLAGWMAGATPRPTAGADAPISPPATISGGESGGTTRRRG
ncbi:hypothetical protein BO70DRAFT_397033 [Aspergillus heteromorphus CBS 117.55]|uniref:ER membrane protein complex subunit 7 beta-sandwich domain-containing protein n=1 Tax=Aspergillus heteromorphus CBS 117.55 TaxID=1448321 RepID=A0A317VYV6_9EURO|nr:uncharacterized protein BO70DRAFT_397033 [Aspergillus heteromorphus CBS 117.55]PWY79546.1 hypothetical protein BO70DRAFT_397033 [Aspergillus heteromorphus CBS 117.55]